MIGDHAEALNMVEPEEGAKKEEQDDQCRADYFNDRCNIVGRSGEPDTQRIDYYANRQGCKGKVCSVLRGGGETKLGRIHRPKKHTD
jgi:hypothetical protein